jgi:RluA family pseudouridine synthase
VDVFPQSPLLTFIGCGLGWLAIDKPSGMSVHNDPEGRADALSVVLNLIENHQDLKLATNWEGRRFPPAAVHRLDRDTSGVLLFATTKAAATELQQAFENRVTKKVYRAILRGKIAQPEDTAEDIAWTFPLSDRAEGRATPQGNPRDRVTCETKFRVLRANDFLSEIEADLMTGRQHQIRRHAVLAKHPVVGDRRYGDPKYLKTIERRFGFSRLMLHACRLELPYQKQTLRVEAPIPEEFARMMENP